MARNDTSGMATVIKLLAQEGRLGAAAPAAGGQDDLFDNPEAPLPLPPEKGASGPRGGRPVGARSRTTQEWARLFLAQNRAPLMVLGNLMSQDTEDLHARLQAMADRYSRTRTLVGGQEIEEKILINPMDVLRLQLQAASVAAEYVHQKQPKAVEIRDKPRGVVLLDLGADDGELAGDDLALPLAPAEQDQALSEPDPAKSDVDKSDGKY